MLKQCQPSMTSVSTTALTVITFGLSQVKLLRFETKAETTKKTET